MGARGLTLIEMVIVLAVVGLLVGLLAPLAYQLFTAERSTAVENEVQTIYQAIVGDAKNGVFGYVGDVGKYPASLLDLVVQPKDKITKKPLPGWKGPYFQNPRLENSGTLVLHLDTFARPYEYFLKPLEVGVGNKLAIISRGLDGVSTNVSPNPNLNPNIAVNYTGPSPTDSTYKGDPKNADNIIFPRPENPDALNIIVSGDVALNVLNYDNNPKVNAFVPACPELFTVRATSVARGSVEANLPYVQGLSIDLVQGQYSVKIIPQDQKTVSWTETLTVLPATTLTRTLNLTGLDSSGTPLFNVTVVNRFMTTDVEVFEFDSRLTPVGAPLGQTKVAAGQTAVFTPHACAQMFIKTSGKPTILDQFVMSYGQSTRIVGAKPANLTVINKVEKRLLVFRNKILIGTVPKGDVHDDEGQTHPHVKTKTFKDLMAGDMIDITDNDLVLLASRTLAAGDNTLTVQ